ncbi:MAG: hypothetical protein J6T01_05915 [Kiritimatiellae bacterium]|nr:hypothetical protein [Kiritimatiellia bacterium]
MKIVVTAGPTREFIDPARFLSNPSTGRMGFAVADAAARRGHDVTLVAGPVALKTPRGVKRVDVVSAREMNAAVAALLDAADSAGARVALVAAAAVADWRPARTSQLKLRKADMKGVLRLVRNPDIAKAAARRRPRPFKVVGFAAETGDALCGALDKCRGKRLDFVVANDISRAGSGFGTATDEVSFAFPDGSHKDFPLMSKRKVALNIIKEIENED